MDIVPKITFVWTQVSPSSASCHISRRFALLQSYVSECTASVILIDSFSRDNEVLLVRQEAGSQSMADARWFVYWCNVRHGGVDRSGSRTTSKCSPRELRDSKKRHEARKHTNHAVNDVGVRM